MSGNPDDMTDSNEPETKRPLTLRPSGGKLELKKPLEGGPSQVRQSFSHGRSKAVTVEVKKKRAFEPPRVPGAPVAPPAAATPAAAAPATAQPVAVQVAPATASIAVAPVAPTPTVATAEIERSDATPVTTSAVSVAPVAEAPRAAPVEAAPSPAAAESQQPSAAPTAKALTPVEPEAVPVIAADVLPSVEAPAQKVAALEAAPAPTAAEPPSIDPPAAARPPAPRDAREQPKAQAARPQGRQSSSTGTLRRGPGNAPRTLTEEERASRVKALQGSIRATEEARRQSEIDEVRRSQEAEVDRQRRVEEEAERKVSDESRRRHDEEVRRRNSEEDKSRQDVAARQKVEDDSRRQVAERAGQAAAAKVAALTSAGKIKPGAETEEDAPKRPLTAMRPAPGKLPPPVRTTRGPTDQRRRTGKLTVSRALSDDEGERTRSLASVRRARERERLRMSQQGDQVKIVRDVVVPETITVQELAQRMAERGTDVVKALMRIGVMATLNEVIDADTAELIVGEFGHNLKRVAEADVEIGMRGDADIDENRQPRPPVVTIMGHVDHGKTSLLDALRKTDVVAGEAGGITQHIGAYQVTLKNDRKITFIDTPGHQAFTAMRARGADVTDVVVLVVAADDGIKEQTIEAIRHAKAANAPIIVAINKMDRPGADPNRVRQELLQHDLVTEDMGGDVLDVEVSALQKTGLDKLEEAILLQAELLDLRANPDRAAEGIIIEAKLERGRGPVATVLIKRGTLKVGDIFVAGGEWGRVRALIDDRGEQIKQAGPSTPVEVLGLNGSPFAGDDFSVVENETRARDITEFRQRRKRDAAIVAGGRGTLEEMFSAIAAGAAKEMPIVVKSDVQGSLEAILASLKGLSTNEVAVRVLHGGVGGINESDVSLARASNAVVIGFNVRANPQARDLARRDSVDIRYYSIIYDVIDDVRKVMEGMLAPELREQFLGNAEIRQVFDITKVGKIGGCYITEGIVRRGAHVRLLRDNVVIHQGSLKTLKRFKDEVKEVREGYECGMAFENYADIQVGDIIECFDVEEVARTLQ